MNKILLVEDDVFLRDGLVELLTSENYSLTCAVNAKEAKEKIMKHRFDLIILDVMLPDESGFALCKTWRSDGNTTPILFLTACDDEIEIVRGLDSGGDDYVTKPFRLKELLSRIRALLRRNVTVKYNDSGLKIDLEKMSITQNGQPILITPTEFQLLCAFVRNPGRVLTRKQLLQSIWDDAGVFIDDNTLSVHISRLRDKIGKQRVKTIRGVGYKWEEICE